jgi:hypothetical protein
MTVIQNDRVEELDAGDIGLMDSTQPVTFIVENGPGRGFVCASRASL